MKLKIKINKKNGENGKVTRKRQKRAIRRSANSKLDSLT